MIPIILDLPPSTNKLYVRRSHSIRLSDEGRIFKEYAALMARSQWGSSPLKGDVKVTIKFYGGKTDIDNFLKATFDSLNTICFVDDKQIKELHCYIVNRKDDNPRMEIEIEELPIK